MLNSSMLKNVQVEPPVQVEPNPSGCAGHPESIYELKEIDAGQLVWTKWNKELTYPRYFTQAMLIPDELANC